MLSINCTLLASLGVLLQLFSGTKFLQESPSVLVDAYALESAPSRKTLTAPTSFSS